MKTNTYSIFWLALTLALAGLTGCSVESRKASLLTTANASYQAGNLEKAKIEYLNVLKLDPSDPNANERLGIIWMDQGAPLRAGPYLQKARDLRPTDNQVRIKLGQAFFAIGKTTEARAEALLVLSRTPDQPDALQLLAITIRLADEYDRAAEVLAAVANRSTVGYQLASAQLSLQRGDVAAARLGLRRATTLDPNSAKAHAAMAAFYHGQNNATEAAKSYETAIKLAPPRSEIHLDFAAFKIQSGKLEEAVAHLQHVTRQTPDYLPAWRGLAQIALIQGKHDEAGTLLQKVLSLDPDNYDALILGADVALAKGDSAKAIAGYKSIGVSFPGLARDRHHLALALVQTGKPTEAVTVLEEAIQNQPDLDAAIMLLAKLDIQAGREKRAISSMVRLLARRANLAEAQLILAGALRSLGRLDDAILAIREQIRISPRNGASHYLLGLMLLQQRQLPEARAAFERALELEPNFLPAVAQLNDLDLQERNFAKALSRTLTLLQATPDSADALYLEAKVHAVQGKWTEANAILRKAIELDANHSESYGLLLTGMIANKQLTQAAQELAVLRARSPDNLQLLMLSGSVFLQQNDAAKAQEVYERVLTLKPDTTLALNNLAYVYADKLGQLDRGYELARKARELAPQSGSVADTLGWIQYRRKEYAAALELLKEAVAAQPADPAIQFHFGMASQQAGQLEAARAAFQIAANSNVDFPEKDQIKSQPAFLSAPAAPR